MQTIAMMSNAVSLRNASPALLAHRHGLHVSVFFYSVASFERVEFEQCFECVLASFYMKNVG